MIAARNESDCAGVFDVLACTGFVALAYAMTHPLVATKPGRNPNHSRLFLEFCSAQVDARSCHGSVGKQGSGGDLNPLPPTAGELAPPSKLVFAPPRLPDGKPHPLPC